MNTWLVNAEVNSYCDMVKLAMNIMVQAGVVEGGGPHWGHGGGRAEGAAGASVHHFQVCERVGCP